MIDGESTGLGVLREVRVSLRAELGNAHLTLGEVLALAEGCVVPLECAADAPASVTVNGVAVASGDLVVDEDGRLAIEIRQSTT